MLIGYACASKADGSQSTDLDLRTVYSLKALRDGDILTIWKLDRLGRNLHHIS